MGLVTARLIRHAPHISNDITKANGHLLMQVLGILDRNDYQLAVSSPEPRARQSGINYLQGRHILNIDQCDEFGALTPREQAVFIPRAKEIKDSMAERGQIITLEEALFMLPDFPVEEKGHTGLVKLIELAQRLFNGRIAVFSHGGRIEAIALYALRILNNGQTSHDATKFISGMLREGEHLEITFDVTDPNLEPGIVNCESIQVQRHPQWIIDMMKALKGASIK